MQTINALSLTENVKHWLAVSQHPRVLHVFDEACNLINEHAEVLSIVTQKIGNGPFNLVVEGDILLSNHLNAESKISVQLDLGNLTICIKNAKLWPPSPNWKMLHDLKEKIHSQLRLLPIPSYRPSISSSLLTTFSTALVNADIPSALATTRQLAGLGQGLTPAGDDFMMGALHASRIIHPPEIVSALAKEIVETAPALTTSLSAAWLRSAGRGEAGILWHNFFNALIADDPSAIQLHIAQLLSVGHTSGADAFAGFISTLIHDTESEEKPCPS